MLTIEATGSVIGARMLNLSLVQVPDADTLAEIETALERYAVLIFPEQGISPRQLVEFSEVFGPLACRESVSTRRSFDLWSVRIPIAVVAGCILVIR